LYTTHWTGTLPTSPSPTTPHSCMHQLRTTPHPHTICFSDYSPVSSCQLAKVTRSIVPVFDANKRRTRAYCALTSRCNRRYIPYSAQDCQPRILLQPNLLPFPPTCAQNPAHPKSWQRGRRKATKQLCLANTRNQSEDASIAGTAKHVSLSRLLLSACRHKPLPTTRLLMRNPLAGGKCQER
jgi:hypothetical protein